MSNDPTYEQNYQDYKPKRGGQPGNQSARQFDPETAAIRATEIRRRNSSATYRAYKVLAAQHPDEFRTYLRLARAEVRNERGPLPGDTE